MTTTILFPQHSNSFGESDPYARSISAMTTGQGNFFGNFNTTGAAESSNYDIQASQHQNLGQAAAHNWSLSPLSIAQPQSAQHALVSQAHADMNQTSTTNINPVALSTLTFTPANRRYYDSTSTISPSQSHFDTSNSASPVNIPLHPRRDSLYPKEDDTPCMRSTATIAAATTTTTTTTTRRRRNSEYVEPGSARAIYLEKNRRAASKCRSKQKFEQEQLVERSREYERRNRMLKAERDMLQAEVRALKDLLGQHAHCPDQRIAQYLQLEANRLATTQDFRQPF